MKKLKICLCAGVLSLCLMACGKNNDEGNSQGTGQSGSLSDAQGSSDAVQGSAQGSSGAIEGDDSDASGSGSVIGTGEEGWSEEMEGIRAAVVEALGEDYWPNMPMDAEMFEMFFDIGPDMYEDYMAESPMISVNVDTLVIVRAKEDTVEAVEEKLNTYRDNKINDTMQYPQNIGKIQASQVERIGNYVVFVQLGAETDADNLETAIAQSKEDNELVIGIIRQQIEQ